MTKPTTIPELWAVFEAERSVALCPTTLQTAYPQVRNWLNTCEHQGLDEIRLAAVEILRRKPLKSALLVAQYLKTLCRWASSEDVGFLPFNPLATFKLPKAPQKEEPVVIPTEVVPVVIERLRLFPARNARWDLLALFQLQLGLRTAEVFGLQWQDVDLDAQRVRIHQNMTLTSGLLPRTKTGRERWVPLNDKAMQVLHSLAPGGPEDFLFPWSRKSYARVFRCTTQQLVKEGVLKKSFRPYDLRHTNISVLLEKGIPVTQVASWAGNSPQIIWQHYANTTGTYEMPAI